MSRNVLFLILPLFLLISFVYLVTAVADLLFTSTGGNANLVEESIDGQHTANSSHDSIVEESDILPRDEHTSFIVQDEPAVGDFSVPEDLPPEESESVSTSSPIAEREVTAVPAGGILLDVPFTPQAPFADWSDPKQQNGCEEAAVVMAISWARSEALTPKTALQEITALADWELANYGHFHDTSAEDTARMLTDYYGYSNVSVQHNITIEDIKNELSQGHVVIIPVNGRLLGNPYFTPPGPREHMLVVRGYDDSATVFIVNDQGTRHGEGMRYSYSTIAGALQEYPSGYHEPIVSQETAMIVVGR